MGFALAAGLEHPHEGFGRQLRALLRDATAESSSRRSPAPRGVLLVDLRRCSCHTRSVSASSRFVNGTPNSGGSSTVDRTLPSWVRQWRACMAACCSACSSSGSIARTRRSRACSFNVFRLFCLATSSSRQRSQGTLLPSAPARGPGPATARRPPAPPWPRVRLQCCSRVERSLRRAGGRARGPRHPVGHVGEAALFVRPACPGPRRRPDPGGRADLLRGRQLFDENGAVLARRAPPVGSRRERRGETCTDSTRSSPTTPPRPNERRPSANIFRGGGPLCPATSRQNPTLSEQTYGVNGKTLIPQGFPGVTRRHRSSSADQLSCSPRFRQVASISSSASLTGVRHRPAMRSRRR